MNDRDKETVLSTGRYWLDAEGFLHGELKPGADYRLADAVEMMALHREMVQGKARGFVMDITAIKGLPRDVRTYFGRPEHVEVHKAVALIVGSPLSRAIGNFFLGLNKPVMPTRLFSDTQHAVEWLRGFERHG